MISSDKTCAFLVWQTVHLGCIKSFEEYIRLIEEQDKYGIYNEAKYGTLLAYPKLKMVARPVEVDIVIPRVQELNGFEGHQDSCYQDVRRWGHDMGLRDVPLEVPFEIVLRCYMLPHDVAEKYVLLYFAAERLLCRDGFQCAFNVLWHVGNCRLQLHSSAVVFDPPKSGHIHPEDRMAFWKPKGETR